MKELVTHHSGCLWGRFQNRMGKTHCPLGQAPAHLPEPAGEGRRHLPPLQSWDPHFLLPRTPELQAPSLWSPGLTPASSLGPRVARSACTVLRALDLDGDLTPAPHGLQPRSGLLRLLGCCNRISHFPNFPSGAVHRSCWFCLSRGAWLTHARTSCT